MSAVITPTLDRPVPARPPAAAATTERAADNDAKESSAHGVVSAIERLALSRERMREAMMPSRKRSSREHLLPEGVGSFASGLVDRVRALPGVAILLEALQDWWARHPLHSVGLVAAEASRRLAAPLAERRPLTLLLGAVLAGALIALLKPWRWLLRPALFAGLVPALLARSVRELPIEHWLQVAAGLASPRPPSPDARDEGLATAAGSTAPPAVAVPSPPINTSATPAAVVREEPSAVYP